MFGLDVFGVGVEQQHGMFHSVRLMSGIQLMQMHAVPSKDAHVLLAKTSPNTSTWHLINVRIDKHTRLKSKRTHVMDSA